MNKPISLIVIFNLTVLLLLSGCFTDNGKHASQDGEGWIKVTPVDPANEGVINSDEYK